MSDFTGFVSGFNAERDRAYKENMDREVANRAMADRVFTTLLQSRDNDMQLLALQGLAAPIDRKKGLAGYFGGVENGANPIYQHILDRANELVPDTSGAPAPTATPGSAAMSTNQTTRPGSEPIAPAGGGMPGTPLPPEQPPATDTSSGVTASPPDLLPMGGGAAGMPMGAPPPPPPNPYKRRGTGVPTAHEIAFDNAQSAITGALSGIDIGMRGSTPQTIEEAKLGRLGAPRSNRNLTQVSQWGVRLTKDGPVLPVLLDQDGGYKLADGQPIPPNAEMVRMSGGAGTGGAGLSSYVEDNPEQRAQLMTQYPGLQLPPGMSPTGYLKIQIRPDGSAMAIPAEFTPPPAYAGTVQLPDLTNPRVAQVAPVLRGGGIGGALGDVPRAEKSELQLNAEALIAAVDKRVQEERYGGTRVAQGKRDQVTMEEATKLGLPFRTYAEAVRAARSTEPVTTRQRTTGGSTAERVLRRLQQGPGAIGAAPPPPPPPPPGPVRSQGPGPVGR